MLGILARDIARHGDVIRYPKRDHTAFFLRHPDHVRQVLESNHTNYRRSATYALIGRMLGDGLLTSEGPLWLSQRRTMQPLFGKSTYPRFIGIVVEEVAAMADRWERREDPGVDLDVANEFSLAFLEVLCLTLFDCRAGAMGQTVSASLRGILAEFERRLPELGDRAPPISRAREESLDRWIESLKVGADRLIAERRSRTVEGDLYVALVRSIDPGTGVPLTHEQIRDQVLTMILSGHDTSSTLLTWTIYQLCRHPEVEAELRSEIERVVGHRTPRLHDLANLTYASQVLDESMRVYPPFWSINRKSVADDRFGDLTIPAGSVVILSPYFTHRHPDFWPDPERFDPDRFHPRFEGTRPKYAFFPFGGGPRVCIGKELATLEATIALVMLLQRFDFHLPADRVVKPKPAVVLRPREGLPLRVVSRDFRPASA